MAPSSGQIDSLMPRTREDSAQRPFHRRLEGAFERAMRNQNAGRQSLRIMIREVVRERETAGERREAVSKVIMAFLANHPVRDALDRVSVVDGSRSSDRLLNDVREWIAQA